jgi:hypothetical protein
MQQRLLALQQQIASAAARAGRSADEITLIAVSKTRSLAKLPPVPGLRRNGISSAICNPIKSNTSPLTFSGYTPSTAPGWRQNSTWQ